MDAPRIAVVDYHKGNLSSVVRGLARAGAAAYATDNPDEIRSAEGLVLPGVGSFYDAIAYMSESGQDRAVMDAVADGAPFLGICLGQQLLLERGDEGVPVAGDNEGAGGGAVAVPCSDDPGWCGDGLGPRHRVRGGGQALGARLGFDRGFVHKAGRFAPQGASRWLGPDSPGGRRCVGIGLPPVRRCGGGRQRVLYAQLRGGPGYRSRCGRRAHALHAQLR